MQKKALIVTTVSGFVPQFEMNNVRILQEMEYEVHYAANYNTVSYGNDNSRLDGTGIVRHQVDFDRSPFNFKENFHAYQQLKEVVRNGNYSLIHCHTPVGAALTRLVVKALKSKNEFDGKVIYTAHGFHFYKGAPLKYWLLFYTAEKWLAKYTDVLITINKEDFERAKRFCRHKKTQVEFVPGVGVDTNYFGGYDLIPGEREEIRKVTREQLGVKDDEMMLLSVGELIPRKNHSTVIKAVAENKNLSQLEGFLSMPKFFFMDENAWEKKYFIAGQGVLEEELQKVIEELHLSKMVTLLGYRSDIRALLYAADVFVFPSRQEGMPVALIEAVAAKVPVIVSDIRGNKDVISENIQVFETKYIGEKIEDIYMKVSQRNDLSSSIRRRNIVEEKVR